MADLRINKQQWDSLSLEEQKAISDGLRTSGAIKIGDRIVGDTNVPPFDASSQFSPMWNPLKDVCKAACGVAAAAGAAWCTANTVGLGLAACLAAAEVARQECENRC